MNTVSAQRAESRTANKRFSVSVALSEAEVAECQKLRFHVFGVEMGAELDSSLINYDVDYFDAFCKHLIVRDQNTQQVVATTRVLTDCDAREAGRFYSQDEFDLSNILKLNGSFMEIGRTCVHPDFRNGAVINHLWSGVARLMVMNKTDYLFGCVSIPLEDNGRYLASLVQYVKNKHYAPTALQVSPTVPLLTKALEADVPVVLPSLLKRYLNIGALVCGDPCLDAKFKVADLFILVDRDRIHKRYQRHFLESA